MRNDLYIALLCLTVSYVLWRGERAERQAVGVLVAAVLLTGMLVTRGPSRFDGPEYGVFAVDLIYYLAMLMLAALTQRAFALWISAIIGAQLLLHLARMLAVHVDDWVYSNSVTLWSYPKLVILVFTVARRRAGMSGTENRFWLSFFRSSMPSSLTNGRNDF